VTGLTLHADLSHLLGNLGFGVLFGLMVSQLFGAGLGWLAILAAGAGGNLLNAMLHGPGHTAVGASTALFGAVGILSAYIWRRHPIPWRGGIRRFAPLSGGLLLLVFLGTTGERTDIGAHLSGFLAGCLVGLLLAAWDGRLPGGGRAQWAYGLTALGTVLLAWVLALATRGQLFSL
jgi:membrane associated rhomboid family serine protease